MLNGKFQHSTSYDTSYDTTFAEQQSQLLKNVEPCIIGFIQFCLYNCRSNSINKCVSKVLAMSHIIYEYNLNQAIACECCRILAKFGPKWWNMIEHANRKRTSRVRLVIPDLWHGFRKIFFLRIQGSKPNWSLENRWIIYLVSATPYWISFSKSGSGFRCIIEQNRISFLMALPSRCKV